MGEAGVPAGVLYSAPAGLFATAHSAASDEFCSSHLESVGERPLQLCAWRASGGSSKLDCQLSDIQATLSCRHQNTSNVFRRTRR